MTLEELQKDWQQYAIDIDVEFKKEDTKVKHFFVLKNVFSACFYSEEDDCLMFDTGAWNGIVRYFRCDEEDNCYMKFPPKYGIGEWKWIMIGKFVKLSK